MKFKAPGSEIYGTRKCQAVVKSTATGSKIYGQIIRGIIKDIKAI